MIPKYGEVGVGDVIFCKSLHHEKGYAWYEVKAISDEEGFRQQPHCSTTLPDEGFLIDDNFMHGRGSYIRYHELGQQPASGGLEEIEI